MLLSPNVLKRFVAVFAGLFVSVLFFPAQAQALHANRLLEPTLASVTLASALNAPIVNEQCIESTNTTSQDTTPATRTHSASPQLAVLSLYRGSGFSGQFNSESDASELNLSDWPLADQKTDHPAPLLSFYHWYATISGACHRISGWKETNALYVALNSQF
jgi:hypothetical protein